MNEFNSIETHSNLNLIPLKSDSHVSETFVKFQIFPSLVRKNTIICLLGV